jgi:hypothetical protein
MTSHRRGPPQGEGVRAKLARSLLFASLGLLGACSSGATAANEPKVAAAKPKAADTEALQKATALAHGNLAWEIVQISAVQREPDKVTWEARTRSEHMRCTASPDGSGSYCEPLPDSPGL